jgi:myo-inositol catabolism protein IolC
MKATGDNGWDAPMYGENRGKIRPAGTISREVMRRADCEQIVEVAHRHDGQHVGLIVLERGASQERVLHWLQTAASVPGFLGFAVGRTSFWKAVVDFEAKRLSREAAATQIAQNFEEWNQSFEAARQTGAVVNGSQDR